MPYCRSDRVAERLALPTSDHGVSGSSPAGGEIISEPKRRFITQRFSCSSIHRSDMNVVVVLVFYGPSTQFRSFQLWSVNLSTLLLDKPPRQVYILSPATDNCPSWISGRERMTVEITLWPASTKECCRMWGSNPRPSAYQADADPTALPRPSGMNEILLKGTLIRNSFIAKHGRLVDLCLFQSTTMVMVSG